MQNLKNELEASNNVLDTNKKDEYGTLFIVVLELLSI